MLKKKKVVLSAWRGKRLAWHLLGGGWAELLLSLNHCLLSSLSNYIHPILQWQRMKSCGLQLSGKQKKSWIGEGERAGQEAGLSASKLPLEMKESVSSCSSVLCVFQSLQAIIRVLWGRNHFRTGNCTLCIFIVTGINPLQALDLPCQIYKQMRWFYIVCVHTDWFVKLVPVESGSYVGTRQLVPHIRVKNRCPSASECALNWIRQSRSLMDANS